MDNFYFSGNNDAPGISLDINYNALDKSCVAERITEETKCIIIIRRGVKTQF